MDVGTASRMRQVTTRPAALVAANISIVTGALHLAAAPAHLEEWWGYGAFFVLVSLFQLAFGAILCRGANALLAGVGIWANLGTLLVYVWSRTAGVPVGPHAHHPEEVGLLDMTVSGLEVVLVLVLVSLLAGATRRRTIDALLLSGVSLWVLRLTGVLA